MCSFSKAWRLNREGMAACNAGDFDLAENNLKTAIKLSGCKSKKIHQAAMYNNLAVIYQMCGRLDDAHAAYGEAVKTLNPDHKGQAALIARIMGKMGGLKKVA